MKKHSKPKARRQKSANAVQSETLTPQVEEALRAGEERLRALTDNLPGVVVYQIDSGEDGKLRRFTYISEGVERLHGITVAEALNSVVSKTTIPHWAYLARPTSPTDRNDNTTVLVRL